MFPITKHYTILEAMEHIKKNISPKAASMKANTFDEGFRQQNTNTIGFKRTNTVIAHNLGEIELNEPIVDTTLFMQQITMAMFPSNAYPEEWTRNSKTPNSLSPFK